MVGSDQAWISYILGKKNQFIQRGRGLLFLRSDFISNKIVDLPLQCENCNVSRGEKIHGILK